MPWPRTLLSRTASGEAGVSGFRYVPQAEVFVRYPTSYSDWLKQKVRSAGGYAQPMIARSPAADAQLPA